MAPLAHWIPSEELALIDFLIAHKAEAGNGGSFKATTFQKAAKHVSPLLERGAVKNGKSCGNKYCAVCCTHNQSIFRDVSNCNQVVKALPGRLCNPVHLRMDLG